MSVPMDIDNEGLDNFDIDAYASEYSSRTRVERLVFIAERCGVHQMELDAYRLAVDLLKKGMDVEKYSQVIEKVDGRLGAGYVLDEKWIEVTQKTCHQRQDALESQLHGYKSNAMKECIRMGHNDLAAFHYECGNLQEALKEYSKTRDYCTTPKHHAQLCLNLMRVALGMKTMGHLAAHLRRTDQLPAEAKSKVFQAQVHCLHGLRELEGRKYEAAAHHFVQVDPEIAGNFTDVMSVQDVSIYGGLLALATFNREHLKSKVLSNIAFKEFLVISPDIRNCIQDFHSSRYGDCLSRLDRMKPVFMVDIYLHSHVEELYAVSLDSMANAFNTSISDLEEEVVGLIMSGKISARIDSQRRILHTHVQNDRQTSFSRAESLTRSFLQENKALLVRLNLLKYDLVQKQIGERRSRKSSIGELDTIL